MNKWQTITTGASYVDHDLSLQNGVPDGCFLFPAHCRYDPMRILMQLLCSDLYKTYFKLIPELVLFVTADDRIRNF